MSFRQKRFHGARFEKCVEAQTAKISGDILFHGSDILEFRCVQGSRDAVRINRDDRRQTASLLQHECVVPVIDNAWLDDIDELHFVRVTNKLDDFSLPKQRRQRILQDLSFDNCKVA